MLSTVAVPAAKPKPAEHVVHAVQPWLPAAALKVAAAQVAHVRSELAVATLFMYEPALHGALTD